MKEGDDMPVARHRLVKLALRSRKWNIIFQMLQISPLVPNDFPPHSRELFPEQVRNRFH